MNPVNRLRKGFKIISAVLLFLLLSIFVYFGYQLNTTRIHSKIYIGQVEVSKLTKDSAIEKVKNGLVNYDSTHLVLKHENQEWQIPFESINAKYNIEEAVNKAYNIGRTGNFIENIFQIAKSRFGKKIDIVFGYDKKKLVTEIENIAKHIDQPKQDAKIMPSKNGVSIVPHVIGKKLDLDKAVQMADESINKMNLSKVELPISQDMPQVLDNQLLGLTDELGAFSTTFNASDLSRTHNIKTACSRINGQILKPGQIFSLDKTLFDRNAKNGYKLAKAYLEGEVVEEIGGGVCQIATTLYDAVLYSNLKVVERKPHSMMVGYVNPGMDATLSDKGIDFKFMNSNAMPIYLYSTVEGNKVTMKIFGKKQDPTQRVELETEVTEIFYAQPEEVVKDNSLQNGARKVDYTSKNGYRSSLYKKIYKNGNLISRELVSENLYRPLRGKIRIGI